LADIWRWNAQRYDASHANEYIEFLKKRAYELETDYSRGHRVPKYSAYRYVTIKKKSGGHGHVLIYLIQKKEICALYFFHTAQDWPAQLRVIGARE